LIQTATIVVIATGLSGFICGQGAHFPAITSYRNYRLPNGYMMGFPVHVDTGPALIYKNYVDEAQDYGIFAF